MKIVVLLAVTVLLAALSVISCGGDKSDPGPVSTPTHTPAATPALTPVQTPTPTATPVPNPIENGWLARYDGPAGGADWALAMAIDSAGNVYVTGKSFRSQPYNYSYLTVKYDGNGDELWTARYDGPGGDDDVAQAIAVDSSSNVYVTGKSYNGLHEDYAYATVKYDSEGNELWAARYDGPEEGDDEALALALDGSGNIYVTGNSNGDYATVKYDSEGNELWAASYDGGPGSDNRVAGIGLDGSGGVYISGTSQKDYVTVKYDSHGNELWVARYNGRGDTEWEWDKALAMSVDVQGNVYVTGTRYNSNFFEYEIATVKYDSEGNRLWVAVCSNRVCGNGEARAIFVDEMSNVYVAGRSFNYQSFNYGCTVIKYDSSGNQVWLSRYDMPGGKGNDITAMDVDNEGNVYITSNLHKGTGYDYAFLTVKYDSSGNEEWAYKYDGPAEAGLDQPAAIAVDETGNVYVTGRSDGGASNSDYATIKYQPRE